jgi:ligand-binding sensor domain-containing protein
LFACLFLPIDLGAQNEQLTNYSLREGLPQSQVYDVLQDNIGFLWLGTQGGGLARFDGEEFLVFNETDGLLSNFIQALYHKEDTLLIGTKDGLSVKVKNQFSNYTCPFIYKIIQQDGVIYCATEKGIWEYANDTLMPSKQFATLKNIKITDIHFYKETYWLSSLYGLWQFKKGAKKPKQLSRVAFTSVVSRDSLTFAASFTDGIYVFKNGLVQDTIKNIKRINTLSIEDDNLWVASNTNGIIIYDLKTLKIQKRINKSNGLKTTLNVKKCFKDQQANVWIGTSGGGLYKYAPTNFTHFTTNSGLLGNRVYALEKHQSAIIASNAENGLVKIEADTIEEIEDYGFLDVKVKALAVDSVGTLWVGTNGKGILKIEEVITTDSLFEDSIFIQLQMDTIIQTDTFNTENAGLPSNWIRDILLDNQTIWVATYSDGIAQINLVDSNEYQLITYGIRQGIKDLLINDIALDDSGKLWYATRNGALGYIWKNRVAHFPNILKQKVAIGSILIKENNLFLGTIGKGIWWTNKKDSLNFYPLVGEKELFSNNIYQLIFDNENNLWAGSEKGVDKVILNEANQIIDVFHFGSNDGFLGIETCLNAIEKDNDGNIWFGTINGLTQYQALEEAKHIERPTIHFGDLELVYQQVDSIDFSQFEHQAFEVKPDEKHLSLNFRTVDLNHPKGIAYQWRLNDEDWSNWTNENKVNFANLDYGDYTFQVQSRNIDWRQSEPIQFKFTVLTPWYKQKRVQAAAIFLLLLIIAGLIYRYIQQLKTKNKAAVEKLELQNHLLSLEQKALQLQMNPHFIFNVLNGIKSLGIRGETKPMNTTINTFAKLLRSVLNNSRQEQISLSQEIKTLEDYIILEQGIQTKPFKYEFITQLEYDAEEIMIPPMLIQPFVENSIRHGLNAVSRDGLLSIIFATKNNYLHFEIRDNGIGIEQSKKNQPIKSHQSLALQVTKERIQSLSGTNAIKIEEIIEDNSIKGTKVWFKVPLIIDF